MSKKYAKINLKDRALQRMIFELAKTGVSKTKIVQVLGFKDLKDFGDYKDEEFERIIAAGKAQACVEMGKALLKAGTIDRNVNAIVKYLEKHDAESWANDEISETVININVIDEERDI